MITTAFTAIPGVFAEHDDIDKGGNIILPESVMQTLIQHNINDYPIQFVIKSKTKNIYAGVREFTAEPNTVIIPYWMFEQLGISPLDEVLISHVKIHKGIFAKIQPHQTKFIRLSEPNKILEKELRKYGCLTKNTTISIHYDGEIYKINIIKLISDISDDPNAISIIDTDLKIEFERPVDMPQTPEPEPEPQISPIIQHSPKNTFGECKPKFIPFSGKGRKLNE